MTAPFPVPSRPGTHRLPCPTCDRGPRDRALSVTVEAGGGFVWHCFRCGYKGGSRGPGDAPAWSGRDGIVIPDSRLTAPRQAKDTAKTERARALFAKAVPASGTIAEAYLATRGLELPPGTPLRFSPAAWHHPTKTTMPAMVAPVVPVASGHDAELQGVHLTFLRPDGTGKADVTPARLYQGPKAGGCVKLTPDDDVEQGLAIAEGIESALSAIMAGYPAWACLDAGNLGAFPVLPGIEALTIVADNDDAGTSAAGKTRARYEQAGVEVRVVLTEPGTDLNDYINEAEDAPGF